MATNIYSNFYKEIRWIKETILSEIDPLPESLSSLVEYYLKKRLLITYDAPHESQISQIGRPVPYAVYWFSDAFRLKDKVIVNQLALAMVYSSIATTIRDDIVDGEAKSCVDCFRLYKVFNHLYLEIFKHLFTKNSRFWYLLAESEREHDEYERWVITQSGPPGYDTYSDLYLHESSRYFTSVVYPSLAATALLSGNAVKVDRIKRFLVNYGCGWRIFDDFDDWMVDLNKPNYNNSTILCSIHKLYDTDLKLTTGLVWTALLDEQFIEKTTNTMLYYFQAARREILPLKNDYLTTFIDDQIDVEHKFKHVFASRRNMFMDDLTRIFDKASKHD